MPAYLKHWQQLHMDFDCIYSGFLGSAQQIAIMENTLDTFADADTLVVIDPVLGDDNALYDTMDDIMVQRMVHLISRAHIITPNVTEVKLLLGIAVGYSHTGRKFGAADSAVKRHGSGNRYCYRRA